MSFPSEITVARAAQDYRWYLSNSGEVPDERRILTVACANAAIGAMFRGELPQTGGAGSGQDDVLKVIGATAKVLNIVF